MATHSDVEEPAGESPLGQTRKTVERMWNDRDTIMGTTMILSYAVLSILLVIVTVERTSYVPGWVPGQAFVDPAVQVPPAVYLFAALGACGYVFTRLIREFEETLADFSLKEALEVMTTVLAAIPLAAGVYLLSGFLFDATTTASGQAELSPATMAGVAFLTGLFVKRAYERLGWVADKLMPTGEDAGQVDVDAVRDGAEDPEAEPTPDGVAGNGAATDDGDESDDDTDEAADGADGEADTDGPAEGDVDSDQVVLDVADDAGAAGDDDAGDDDLAGDTEADPSDDDAATDPSDDDAVADPEVDDSEPQPASQ